MPTYLLHLRNHFTPWGMPSVPEVLISIKARFPNDPGLTVIPGRNAELGTYRIRLEEDSDAVISLPLQVQGKEHLFTLEKTSAPTTFSPVSNIQLSSGTLYTLYNCTQGPWSDVTNAHFDACISKYGSITKQTEHQKFKGQTIYNGNRYFCMQATEQLPDSIPISDPTDSSLTYMVRVGYKGKTYHCARCQQRHVGACPERQEFFAAKMHRETMEITTTILSDSTLRQADVIGLRANVTCMSGGRVGNVAHMLLDLPGIDTMKDVVILLFFLSLYLVIYTIK